MYTLSEQIEKQHLGDHICLVYETPEQQMAAVVPFIKQGIARNEACVYIVDDRTISEVKEALSNHGLDIEKLVETGALCFATKRESYLKSGEFDPKAMIEFLRELTENAISNGFTGYRVTGEMTWALGNECACNHLIEYEAMLNQFFPNSKATAICQYNRKRFAPEIIRDVLRTHPFAILGDQVCPNLYYETPEMILGKVSADERVNWMIDNLTRFRSNEIILQEAVQSRDEFLSIASHELKTPITSLKFEIQSLSRLLDREKTGTIATERLNNPIKMTDKQVKRLTKLVDNLLDVSKINAGKLNLELEQIDLGELVSSSVARLEDQFIQAGCTVSVKDGHRINGTWDRLRIEQVITNLLTNALKYGKNNPIEVEVTSDGKSATVSVRDYGIGIAPEDQSRIFDRFERAISANSVSGFGLGLFIVRKIIEVHQGSVRVQSEPGKGSTFTVEIPLKIEGSSLQEIAS